MVMMHSLTIQPNGLIPMEIDLEMNQQEPIQIIVRLFQEHQYLTDLDAQIRITTGLLMKI